MVHVLGYLTLTAIIMVTVFCGLWLWEAGQHTYTWLRRVPVPKFAEVIALTQAVPDGFSDYVGPV